MAKINKPLRDIIQNAVRAAREATSPTRAETMTRVGIMRGGTTKRRGSRMVSSRPRGGDKNAAHEAIGQTEESARSGVNSSVRSRASIAREMRGTPEEYGAWWDEQIKYGRAGRAVKTPDIATPSRDYIIPALRYARGAALWGFGGKFAAGGIASAVGADEDQTRAWGNMGFALGTGHFINRNIFGRNIFGGNRGFGAGHKHQHMFSEAGIGRVGASKKFINDFGLEDMFRNKKI